MPKLKRLSEKGIIADGIDRALEVLECFNTEKAEWGITELSRRTGLGKSRVFRILKTLEGRGFAEKNEETGRYRLGLKVFELGQVVGGTIDLRREVGPILRELSQRTGGTSLVRIVDRDETVTLDAVPSSRTLRAIPPIGVRYPIYYGACGKIFLAFMDPQERSRRLKGVRLRRYTRASITSMAVLLQEVEKVRQQEYAVSDEESIVGLRAVAVPVWNREGKVAAAMGLSFPTPYFPPAKTAEMVTELHRGAERVSMVLGFRPRSPWRGARGDIQTRAARAGPSGGSTPFTLQEEP